MAQVREQGKIYEMINKHMTSLLEKGEIPWRKRVGLSPVDRLIGIGE